MQQPKRMLSRVLAPASEPLTLKETKLYLRLDTSHEDALISDLIVAARMQAEQYLRRSLITQSWQVEYDMKGEVYFPLPLGPVQSITSVSSIDGNGDSQILSASTYALTVAKDAIQFLMFTSASRIEVIYVAGYGDATAVPRPIKLGMLAHIAAMYDVRGDNADSGGFPAQTVGFYAPYREVGL